MNIGSSTAYPCKHPSHAPQDCGPNSQPLSYGFLTATGYTVRWTAERLRVAEALEKLPELGQSLRDGAVSWSIVRELTRVAVPENEHQWLAVARGRPLRQVEELVSGHRFGDPPGEPSGSGPSKHVLRFEVSADTSSTFREAMAKLRRDAGGPLDDDASLLLLARQVLGGPTDAGRASYQVALAVCEACRRGWQQGAGGPALVGSDIVEMARCDALNIGRVPSPATAIQAEDAPPVDNLTHGGQAAQVAAEHRGQLIIEGRVSTGLSFRHADGSRYGGIVEPLAAEVQTRAFQALRALGFREDETRRALVQVRRESPVGHERTEDVLRALAVLATGRSVRKPQPNAGRSRIITTRQERGAG